MNYNTLFILIIVLLFVITLCVHKDINTRNRRRNMSKNRIPRLIIPKKNQHLTPLGKGFAEYIPPASKCSPEKNCHSGSYVDFSTKNL